ncbi:MULTISPECIES: ROK family protein [Bacillaceae]|uniref:ROK family protein n=1 Tax=Evansella alkalicola TaxID=745819 RepID=A0ABS6JVD4_9BACI|nr:MULTISPECIES: ROK family protein [Bacillaceae]MBU9722350.1 ROK family protein [Bacillus alkalicola]
MLIAAFDIGGTSVKYGIVSSLGEILEEDSYPTNAIMGGRYVVNKVIEKAIQLKGKWNIKGISVSSAGQINTNKGLVIYANDNIPGFTGINLIEEIQKHTGLSVRAENDVNCAAIGESWKGNAQGLSDFLCVTIGTGIGGALYLNGSLYRGSSYAAGEIGHLTLYPGGKKCACGKLGCFEQYASSKALEFLISEKMDKKYGLKEFFQITRDGNKLGIEIFNHWINDITTGLASVVHLINIDTIIIGGGVSSQGDFLLKAIQESLYEKIMPNHKRKLYIKLAYNANKANLLGATKHFISSK